MATRVARSAWAVCGLLLVAAAALAAWSTWVNWQPCRGTILLGTPWGGPFPGGWFSNACIDRMEVGPAFPVPVNPAPPNRAAAALGVGAQALTVGAWLAMSVVVTRRPAWSAVPVLLAGPATIVLVLDALVVIDPARELGAWLPYALGAIDAASLATFVVTGWVGRVWVLDYRWLLVLNGIAAFGLVRVTVQWAIMIGINKANWDWPPGTGYLTALALLVAGLTALTMVRWPPRPARQRTFE